MKYLESILINNFYSKSKDNIYLIKLKLLYNYYYKKKFLNYLFYLYMNFQIYKFNSLDFFGFIFFI